MKNESLLVTAIIALIVGALFGALVFPTTKTEYLPGKDNVITEVVNQTVEVEVPSADAYLQSAIEDAWDRELSDNDKFLTCDGTQYDEDEVTLSKVKQWAYVWTDEDEYDVGYQAKYKFDSTDDDDRCTATYDVIVHYEYGEKPKVTVKDL